MDSGHPGCCLRVVRDLAPPPDRSEETGWKPDFRDRLEARPTTQPQRRGAIFALTWHACPQGQSGPARRSSPTLFCRMPHAACRMHSPRRYNSSHEAPGRNIGPGEGLECVAGDARTLACVFISRPGESGASGLVANGFYLITGLGHQAVLVFFVLSGYFVGGSVVDGFQRRRFSWTGYGIARLSRLWTVLLPALLLTLVLDTLGTQFSPTAYQGGFGAQFMSGPQQDAAAAHGWWCWLGICFSFKR